jgi:hypothetical protein
MRGKAPELAMLMTRLLEAIKGVKKAIEENTESIHAAEERERHKQPSGEAVHRIIAFDDKTVRDAKEENDRQYRTQNAVKWATRYAVIAACVYALIAAYQAYISHEALFSVQRAFVFFSPETKQFYLTDKEGSKNIVSWEFLVPIRNSGTTPAKNLRDHIFVGWLPHAITKDFNFHDFENGEDGMANPQDTSFYETEPIPRDVLADTKGGIKHLYIYGWVTYNDVFKGTPQRVTKFCYEMHAIVGDFTTTIGDKGTRTTLCGVHNCSDDGCKEEKAN